MSARLEEMMEQSLALFQKRDDLDELEGFQQQELAKVKHMVRTCGAEWLDLYYLKTVMQFSTFFLSFCD